MRSSQFYLKRKLYNCSLLKDKQGETLMTNILETLNQHKQKLNLPKGSSRITADSTVPAKTNLFTLVTAGIFLAVFGLVAQFANPLISGVTSSAAALTIITAGAVGIERTLETFWTYMGLTRGSWWPLGPVREQLDGLLSSLDTSFEPFYEEAQLKIQELQQTTKWGRQKIDAAAKDLEEIKKHVDQLKKLPLDSQRVQLITASASRSIEYFSTKYPEIRDTARLANFGIQGVSDFVATFKDNPGRRLISLFAGAIAGLIIAGVLRLDLFQAVLQTSSLAQESGFLPYTGVAITGLLMGLGANPTHEAIRLLQEIKNRRKSENVK
ncbi:MAG TPA: hypothetical protein VFQ23_07280 [Anaerolineales bacterium]|nr:hypothetical protein [Anaerolineales bacterium]